MIREITPTKNWPVSVSTYVIGIVVGSTAFGAVAGWVGSALQSDVLFNLESRWWLAMLAMLSTADGLHEFRIIRILTPQITWQVPVTWSKYGKVTQGFLYGTVLGAEIFTVIPYTVIYILLVIEMSLGATGGAQLGFVYGLARASATVASSIYIHLRKKEVNEVANTILNGMDTFHLFNGFALLCLSGVIWIGIIIAHEQKVASPRDRPKFQ